MSLLPTVPTHYGVSEGPGNQDYRRKPICYCRLPGESDRMIKWRLLMQFTAMFLIEGNPSRIVWVCCHHGCGYHREHLFYMWYH